MSTFGTSGTSGTDGIPERDAVNARWPPRGPLLAGVMKRLLWHVNQLRRMAPAEIRHRVLRELAMQAERWRLVEPEPVPPPELANAARPWIHATTKVDASRYLQAAERIAAGRYDVFALRDVELGSPPRWNRDPKTGVEAPLSFGKLLDYRDPRLVGEIKYLWEINRHHHVVTLAQACVLSGDARYFDVIRSHLESWFDACPYLKGPNWSSALESAIRLINWSVAWQLLDKAPLPAFTGAEGARFRQRWLESVFRHAQFVQGHFSLYSSANNHLIGEAAGLYVAAVSWPCWPQARAWLARARAILEEQAVLQNAPDGVQDHIDEVEGERPQTEDGVCHHVEDVGQRTVIAGREVRVEARDVAREDLAQVPWAADPAVLDDVLEIVVHEPVTEGVRVGEERHDDHGQLCGPTLSVRERRRVAATAGSAQIRNPKSLIPNP